MNKKVLFALLKQFIFPLLILSLSYYILIFFDFIIFYQGPIITYLFAFFIVFIVMITIHECTHLLMFLLFKIPIKAIFILGFGILFDPKFKFVYDIKLLKFMGGIVIPKSISVTNQKQYDKLKKAYQSSLFVAPLITLLSPLFLYLMSLIFSLSLDFSIFIVFLSTYYTWVIFPTFFIEHKHMYGDFKAYSKIKSNDILFDLQLMTQILIQGHVSDDLSFMFDAFITKWRALPYALKKDDMILSIILKGLHHQWIPNLEIQTEIFMTLNKIAYRKKDPSFLLETLFVAHVFSNDTLWTKCMDLLIKKDAKASLETYHAWVAKDASKIKHIIKQQEEDLLYFNYVKNEDTVVFWSYPTRNKSPFVCNI